ncbi:AAA family ATPase [Pseudovibrio sp. Ad37]|uniref:AAA family ATPase n=1 Tax=Pseudovibrio sp. Ad37 TaxID=989422 RepID=UPI0007B2461C|nr:AAA family ATPase [Pseudovibrio sp. Ad37]KZL22672.1 Aerobic cobaltochelatase subunit CobS [Pseudovibrio sp. Ad37]
MDIQSYSIAKTFAQEGVPEAITTMGLAPSDNPFIPSINSSYVFRREPLREVLAFLNNPMGDALNVSGPTGSGKTSLICEIAGRLNWPIQSLTGRGRMEFTDLTGHYKLVSSTPGETPSMQFQYGPLAKAMMEGHICLLNEIDRIDPSELTGLNDVLEGRPLVLEQNGGEVIKPHPNFRFIATGNSVGNGDVTGLYQSVQQQDIASMDRYRFTVVQYPEPEDELEVLKGIAPTIPESILTCMIKVANDIRRSFVGEDGNGGALSVTMSTRSLCRWANLMSVYQASDNAVRYALQNSFLRRCSPSEVLAVEQLTKDTFGVSW